MTLPILELPAREARKPLTQRRESKRGLDALLMAAPLVRDRTTPKAVPRTLARSKRRGLMFHVEHRLAVCKRREERRRAIIASGKTKIQGPRQWTFDSRIKC